MKANPFLANNLKFAQKSKKTFCRLLRREISTPLIQGKFELKACFCREPVQLAIENWRVVKGEEVKGKGSMGTIVRDLFRGLARPFRLFSHKSSKKISSRTQQWRRRGCKLRIFSRVRRTKPFLLSARLPLIFTRLLILYLGEAPVNSEKSQSPFSKLFLLFAGDSRIFIAATLQKQIDLWQKSPTSSRNNIAEAFSPSLFSSGIMK
jgi:hypothetical protein